MSRQRDGLPPPSSLEAELPPAASFGLGGIAADVLWSRGPVRVGVDIAGIEAAVAPRAELAGPLRWEVPAILCEACADQSTHGGYEAYRPAEHYRHIAADFLRLDTDASVLAFAGRWGLVQAHRLESPHPTTIDPPLEWSTLRVVPHPADRIDDILLRAAVVRWLYELAYSLDDQDRQLGLREVAIIIRTMALRFAPDGSLTAQLVPTTLLHYVYYALLGLFRGNSRLICDEWFAAGCRNEVPTGTRQGRPRIYCSDSCAWRARNRRRADLKRAQSPIATATSGHVRSVSPSSRRR